MCDHDQPEFNDDIFFLFLVYNSTRVGDIVIVVVVVVVVVVVAIFTMA